jgi:MFS family permease
VLLVQLVRIERRATQPIIPPLLFGNRRLALTYCLAVGGGFAMGSVVFLASIATLAYGVTPEHGGFVLLPLVIASMAGSMVSGRYLNRFGPRALLLAGFALLAAGYALTAWIEVGLWLFLVASVPVGLGLGIAVGGAMRSIAIEEAPPALRTTAQGLVNIANAIGTLTSTAAISAVADLVGGTGGFALAYALVAASMVVMLIVASRLGLAGDPLARALHP